MDLRRTAKKEQVFFGQGNDTAGVIVWYDAPPGAKFFEGETVFRSLDWWDGLPPIALRPGPVERFGGSYVKGETIPGYTGQGTPCGDASWWVNGIPSPPPPNPIRDANGVPDCCTNFRKRTLTWKADSKFQAFSIPLGLAIRQRSGGNNQFNRIPVHFGVDTLPSSTLFAIVGGLQLPGQPAALSIPIGWTVVSFQEVPAGWCYTLLRVNTPSTSDVQFTFSSPFAGELDSTAASVIFEITGLYQGGIIDSVRSRVNSSPATLIHPGGGPLHYYDELEITAQLYVNWFGGQPSPGPGVTSAGLDAKFLIALNEGSNRGLVNVPDTEASGLPYSQNLITTVFLPSAVQPFWEMVFAFVANSDFQIVGNAFILPQFHFLASFTAQIVSSSTSSAPFAFQADFAAQVVASSTSSAALSFQADFSAQAVMQPVATMAFAFQTDFTAQAVAHSNAASAFHFQADFSAQAVAHSNAASAFAFQADFSAQAVAHSNAGAAFAFQADFTASMDMVPPAPNFQVFASAGATTFTVPAGVTLLTLIELWGGGASGGGGFMQSGGGGGGGAFSSITNMSVTPGQVINLTVGTGGTVGLDGTDSWFSSTGTVLAKGGKKGVIATGGAGGLASGGVGSTKQDGGAGANGTSPSGGGGGGAADNSGAGGAASGSTHGTGTGRGGNGGDGSVTGGVSGGPGVNPGGGGGGKHTGVVGSNPPGVGGSGQVIVWW